MVAVAKQSGEDWGDDIRELAFEVWATVGARNGADTARHLATLGHPVPYFTLAGWVKVHHWRDEADKRAAAIVPILSASVQDRALLILDRGLDIALAAMDNPDVPFRDKIQGIRLAAEIRGLIGRKSDQAATTEDGLLRGPIAPNLAGPASPASVQPSSLRSLKPGERDSISDRLERLITGRTELPIEVSPDTIGAALLVQDASESHGSVATTGVPMR